MKKTYMIPNVTIHTVKLTNAILGLSSNSNGMGFGGNASDHGITEAGAKGDSWGDEDWN